MKDLILLHGALGSKEQMNPFISFLRDHFTLHTFSFSGHGGLPVEGEFSISRYAKDLDNYISSKNLLGCSVFGYSMGGYVALQLASQKPGAIGKIMTLGTKFDWTPESAAKEIKMMDVEKIESKVPRFAKMLSERHAPTDWKMVLNKSAEMLYSLGNGAALKENDLCKIKCEVLIALGSEDKMVSREESIWAAGHLPNGKFITLDNIPHALETADPEAIARLMKKFF